jgi:PAS domain S-box-containing protein
MAPLELILARNFLAQISTPGFLVDESGRLVYYNEASGRLLGIRFEEAGSMSPDEWGSRFGPLDEDGQPIPIERLPLAIAFQSGRPAHARFRIRSEGGDEHEIEATAFPINSAGGQRGAMAIFWAVDAD